MASATNQTSSGELPKELFYRTLADPMTGKEFMAIAVKSTGYSTRGRDTDFAPQYEGINPLYYAIVVSPSCFAAEEPVFRRSPKLLVKDGDGLKQYIQEQRQFLPELNGPRTLSLACQSYELALGCTQFLKLRFHELAALELKASWVLRELAESGVTAVMERVAELRLLALQHYITSYEKEDTSTIKLTSAGVGYLIGELNRQLGCFDDSLQWFSRVVTDKRTGAEIKRLARNQMDLCRDQREQAKSSGNYTKPEANRVKERGMYQLYRDQVRWLARVAGEGALAESDLVRGILDGLMQSELDLSKYSSEEELAAGLAQRLKP